MENIVCRIAYYNTRSGTWTIDGDTERYTDERFINIAKTPISKHRPLILRLVFGFTAAFILLILAFILANIAADFFNAIICK